MFLFILGTHIFLTVISFAYMGVILLEKANEVTKYLLVCTVSNLFVILGYTLELMGSDTSYSLTSLKLQILGLVFLISFLVFFICKCCDFELPQWLRQVILFLDVIILGFAMTMEFSTLYLKSTVFVSTGYYPHLISTPGIVSTISLIYTILQISFFTFVSVYTYVKRKGRASMPFLLLSFAFLPTTIAYILFITLTPEVMGFNPVPGSITIGMSFLIFMVYKFRLLDTTQTAKDNIVESVNEIYFVVDVGKKLLFANKLAYEKIPDLRDSKKRGEIIQEVYRNNRKTMELKDRQYQVSVSPFYDKNTLKGYSLWLFDKTDEIENMKRLIELKNKAEEANEAKSIFLANMSHEIRTPMNSIMGSTEMILRNDTNQEVKNLANDIRKSGKLLLAIISGILDFSKIESGQAESVEINYNPGIYLKDVVKQFLPRMQEKGLSFPIHVSPSLPRGLRGDAVQVRQILNNLLDNACKYTKSGFVSLTVDWEQLDSETAKLYLAVEDSGCGIKESAIPELFDSFRRADIRKHIDIQGTGLGLSIVKKLVESLNGEITVESTYGSGSKFSVYIVQKIIDATPIGDFSSLQVRSTGKTEEGENFIAPDAKVLCVDDNATNRKVIKELMSIYRMQVDTASSGEECLRLLEQGKRYHIIFMDQMMPGMDGIETAEAIRTMSGEVRRIPIIALTANALSGAKEMFLEKGFQDYLAKPIELDELKDILLEFLPEKTICYVENKDIPGEYGKAIVLPGADTKAGLARFGGEKSRYLQALKYFYEDGEKQMDRIRGFLEQKDLKSYGLEVHALKGLALGIGAYRLAEMARGQEEAAKNNTVFETPLKPQELLSEYELLIANIRFVLKENGVSPEEVTIRATKDALSEEEFAKEVSVIKDALEMLDENTAEKEIRNLLTTKMSEDKRNLLLKAKEQIQNFDYEEALEQLEMLSV